MNRLLDKLTIFLFCIVIYLQNTSSIYLVVPIIVAIIYTCLNDLINKKIYKNITFVIYALLCIFLKDFIFFLPLICYDSFLNINKLIFSIIVIPVLLNFFSFEVITQILLIGLIGIAILMKSRTTSLEKLRKEYTILRDTTTEFSINLKNKNKELMDKQDYEVNIATLKERNRIARDIHDNIGHLLSSSILQIGALMAITKDDKLKENLENLKQTLSKGMDSIRSSIHDMHDEYIDLNKEITSLVDSFKFCNISLDYDIQSSIDKNCKLCFISIIKEGLSNIIKHSNATKVNITLKEHPAFYQLLISDNGTIKGNNLSNGIGIKNMIERVNNLKGIINIKSDNGYFIFISIPKKD